MITFLRKIRQSLLTEGKTGKYLKYAFGEIILVVVGILIALSIDNWNDGRKASTQETLLLQSLQSEFRSNLSIFDSVFTFHERKEDFILETINYPKQPIPFQKLDTIFEIITYNYTINLSGTIYNSAVSSGKIELIKNTILKNRIAAFDDLLTDFREEEIIAQEITNQQILPFINSHIAIRYPFGDRTDLELQKDMGQYANLARDVEFRNRLIHLKGVCWDITTEGRVVREEIIRIIDDIQAELESK